MMQNATLATPDGAVYTTQLLQHKIQLLTFHPLLCVKAMPAVKTAVTSYIGETLRA